MRSRHTILVVDDEPDVVLSVQELLRYDFRVVGANCANDGMKILEQQEIHVIMTDQRMPGVSGVEFLSRVRGDYPEAIRLLFTGHADIRAVIDSINQGNVYRYITKPWDPDELLSIMHEATERYDLIVERRLLVAELQSKNEALAKADELKTAFIRVASHELRTPLTILLGMSWMVAESRLPPGQERAWMKRIYQAAERLRHLVDQLITMLTAGQFDRPLVRLPEDLAALLRLSADDVRAFTDLRGQSLVLDFPDDLGTLAIEASKIRDSLNHLLLNAIKFTPDGGTITVSAKRTLEGGAELRITDNGNGIDPASLPHLFGPFFTGFDSEHHTSGQFEFERRGLGLGLSIVKVFIELHGGRVEVQSELGRGTTFTITLPSVTERTATQ